jgi:hypothetical protein
MKMNTHRLPILPFLLTFTLVFCTVSLAQQTEQPPADVSKLPFMTPSLPVEQRVNDLLKRMTVEEKVSQLVNQSRAIPRLGIPAYDWWSESLHGVLSNGTRNFRSRSAWLQPSTRKQSMTWQSL